jgi:hypothetical protein
MDVTVTSPLSPRPRSTTRSRPPSVLAEQSWSSFRATVSFEATLAIMRAFNPGRRLDISFAANSLVMNTLAPKPDNPLTRDRPFRFDNRRLERTTTHQYLPCLERTRFANQFVPRHVRDRRPSRKSSPFRRVRARTSHATIYFRAWARRPMTGAGADRNVITFWRMSGSILRSCGGFHEMSHFVLIHGLCQYPPEPKSCMSL